jgi:hypothetical protein
MPARKPEKQPRSRIGYVVTVYVDSVDPTPLKTRSFHGATASLQASAYFREEQGSPESPKAHVTIDYVWDR